MPPLQHTSLTPRNSPRISGSPLAASLPFDWDAANHRKPPPYATPASHRKPRKSLGVNTPLNGTPDVRNHPNSKMARVYRKVALKERWVRLVRVMAIADLGATSTSSVLNWIVQTFYDIQDLPRNRLPEFPGFSRVLGGLLHLIHLTARYRKLSRLRDEDIGWEDMLGESILPSILDDGSWIDWATLASLLLILVSVLNATYLFTRINYYHLFNKAELVNSPSAEFIDRDDLDYNEHIEPPPVITRWLLLAAHAFWVSWTFLMGTTPPQSRSKPLRKVQRLSVWTPDRRAMELFIIYSPLHSLLWQAVSPGNWIKIFILLGIASGQLFFLDLWYGRLVKDREIIASEVLHEYNQKFVYPHIMRVRRDAAVMTNEAETITFYR